MPLDIASDVQAAHKDPGFAAWFRDNVIKPAVVAALADRDADAWLLSKPASRYLYGCDGAEERFRKLRARHPELDRLSVGSGKLRAWRRADLDAFLASDKRAQSRRANP